MTNILTYIKPRHHVQPDIHYMALMRMADLIDSATEEETRMAEPGGMTNITTKERAQVWMNVAIMLADIGNVESEPIRKLARAIWKGSQDELIT
jgi:hypothetical protein